jgi:hypothetical protein
MTETEIEWGYNCLTDGVHHGRPEAIWNIPLGYARQIYGDIVLREMVVARIYNDAMQIVEHHFEAGFTKEWAERIKETANEIFPDVLDSKLKELNDYYQSHGWVRDIQEVTGRIKREELNRGYAPLHGHDTINMLCRIIGMSARGRAER